MWTHEDDLSVEKAFLEIQNEELEKRIKELEQIILELLKERYVDEN